MAAFGAAVGVLIAMAVVVFGLRGKGHSIYYYVMYWFYIFMIQNYCF